MLEEAPFVWLANGTIPSMTFVHEQHFLDYVGFIQFLLLNTLRALQDWACPYLAVLDWWKSARSRNPRASALRAAAPKKTITPEGNAHAANAFPGAKVGMTINFEMGSAIGVDTSENLPSYVGDRSPTHLPNITRWKIQNDPLFEVCTIFSKSFGRFRGNFSRSFLGIWLSLHQFDYNSLKFYKILANIMTFQRICATFCFQSWTFATSWVVKRKWYTFFERWLCSGVI